MNFPAHRIQEYMSIGNKTYIHQSCLPPNRAGKPQWVWSNPFKSIRQQGLASTLSTSCSTVRNWITIGKHSHLIYQSSSPPLTPPPPPPNSSASNGRNRCIRNWNGKKCLKHSIETKYSGSWITRTTGNYQKKFELWKVWVMSHAPPLR